ncbi:MAG: cell envelope biogenesis protein OmpA [Shackletoniella antarctica]|uniref:Cell envelope biogenesis protein OmpA n=1 Tax=Shackletoniella antarctica TaxID=268115 RepID=A0A2W4WK73_9CYAN|nr:MAG: cell envelope biogenesis protein OmpA [Shackletoniella antarctica]
MNQQWWIGCGALPLWGTSLTIALVAPGLVGVMAPALGQSALPAYSLVVTSPLDGPVADDEVLTLREALELANGTLTPEDLSAAEQALVEALPAGQGSQISFALPEDQAVIALVDLLPEIVAPELVIDGTTQAGYDADAGLDPRFPPAPVVSLTVAEGIEVARGLTIAADGVTVRGLSVYGFRTSDRATQTTPPSDIFVSALAPPVDASPLSPVLELFRLETPEAAPRGVVIEQNWLGLPPDEAFPAVPSAFGVTVFNAVETTIRNNRIQNHDGSAIITGFRADGLQVSENAIIGNGLSGMPDAIRLEGTIDRSAITNNLICANDGSGIYIYRPEGATQISGNAIQYNGRRFERAAVYLMGSDHQVNDNFIGYQPGPGVVVTAYPESRGNQIRGNRYAELDGLAIDLNTQGNIGVQDFQKGDGPNPPRNSHHRRRETGNAAIDAPQFDSYTFATGPGQVTLTGTADPNSEVDLYRVDGAGFPYSPLSERLGTVTASPEGSFSASLSLPPGTRVSAIASDPEWGTSEPAAVAAVATADGAVPELPATPIELPSCAPPAPPPEPEVPPTPLEPLRLEIPRNIHFALDRSNISSESAAVLDQIAASLLEFPFLTVELHGHTDPRASAAYNLALSERRALAARDYLIRQGVPQERMRIVPFGLTQRRSDESSRLAYARDRRVEFVFTDLRGLEIIFIDQEADLQLE